MNKYGARKISFDGFAFDSKKEAARWQELRLMLRAGVIDDLRRQVPFELIPRQMDGKRVSERAVNYIADFVYTENGRTVVEDVKSPATRTPEYIIKRKLMRWVHGITIKEV
jgi:hypothetical protein